MNNSFEFSQPEDLFYNYCLHRYDPPAPVTGKFRPVNLLRHSFAVSGAGGAMYDMVKGIQSVVGVGNTVWGVKMLDHALSWEYYFYDYRRRERERSLSRVLHAMRPWVTSRLVPNENLHYFMFSVDITADLLQEGAALNLIHLYIGNPGSAVSAGICYAVTEEHARLENFYHFYCPQEQLDDIIAKVVCSAQIDDRQISLDEILWPELRDCLTICCANKSQCDCIYFSGITVEQFLFFLRAMRYPEPIVSFVDEHRARLDHLLFDVGFDYRMENGTLVILKSSYYGTF